MVFKLIIMFNLNFKQVSQYFKAHLAAFLYDLDPIENDQRSTDQTGENTSKNVKKKINTHYLLAFITVVIISLESVLLLVRSNFDAQNCPELFHHKIYLQSFWKYTDNLNIGAMTVMLLVYGKLIFNWTLGEKYRMAVCPETGQIVANGKSHYHSTDYFF